MTTENVCPFCGGPIENVTDNKCPSCGSAIASSASSAATMISPRSSFNSSAEVMDEVKKLEREGNSGAAAQVLGSEFGLNQTDAEQTADQIQFEMQHDGREIHSSAPEAQSYNSKPEIIDAPGYDSGSKPSNRKNWIIGGSIGATVFLCCCCCLPIISLLLRFRGK